MNPDMHSLHFVHEFALFSFLYFFVYACKHSYTHKLIHIFIPKFMYIFVNSYEHMSHTCMQSMLAHMCMHTRRRALKHLPFCTLVRRVYAF